METVMKKYKRVVIKVGSSTLTHSDGNLNIQKIKQIVKEISLLLDDDYECVFVTSGAVTAGMGALEINHKPTEIDEHQALAAIGQVALIQLYSSLFFAFDHTIAQLLLTRDDFSNRTRYLNARNTCQLLLDKKILPIINENDSVSIAEIKLGDNDSLSALVAALIDADLIVIVSDIEGLYDENPKINPNAKLIKTVHVVDDELKSKAGLPGSKFGTGGMITKLQAAEMALSNGTDLIITSGEDPHNITRAVHGEAVGTHFFAEKPALNAKKYWLRYATTLSGYIHLDKGAYKAILKGKSLLPAGIIRVDGRFDRGSVVQLIYDTEKIAIGIVNYSNTDIKKIMGEHTNKIKKILGYQYSNVVIHSDNMAKTD
ncbi:MAG: glutamate 5-kinase [Clostridiaceae bacterium]|nr:glutamate 5-kinase [Clostridiaceae bacterium]